MNCELKYVGTVKLETVYCYECSVCHSVIRIVPKENKPIRYCPYCGARVVNDSKPVEVWQQASADDVTCHEVREDA